MTLYKACAIACIVAVLGMQAVNISPGYPAKNHYWPFMNYPMYSDAHHLGEAIVRHELHAAACNGPGTARTLGWEELRVEPFIYWGMLDRLAASSAPGGLLDTLARVSRTTIHLDPCALELWRQALVIGRRGVRIEDAPWVKIRAWRAVPGSGWQAIQSEGTRP